MEMSVETVGVRTIIGIRDTVNDPGPLFESALPTLFGYCAEHGIVIAGPPLGIYYHVADGVFDMAVAIPVDGLAEPVDPSMFFGSLPGGRVVRGTHVGPYDQITQAWGVLMEQAEADGLTRLAGPCWEEYKLGPDSGKNPSEWRTDLVQPITATG
jgi:effector-binding domain-containing protein